MLWTGRGQLCKLGLPEIRHKLFTGLASITLRNRSAGVSTGFALILCYFEGVGRVNRDEKTDTAPL